MPFFTTGMNKKAVFRIISYFVLLASILSMPWWLSLVLVGAFLFYFNKYYEAVFFALLSDIVYATPVAKLNGFVLVSFSIVFLLTFLIEFLKKRMSFDL